MLIRDWRLEERAETREVSAEVDGFRIWYRLPKSCRISEAADPFLARVLLPAMSIGESIEIDPDLPVSPKFLQNCDRLQEIFHTWNPVFRVIAISASTRPAETLNEGTLAFFSGGLDSTYTFLKHQDEITNLAFIHGFNFPEEDVSDAAAAERNRRVVEGFEKTLIPIETNASSFGHRYHLSGLSTVSSGLGAVMLLLGYRRSYLPSGVTYNTLTPLGSHPLTDPLFANEGMEVVHDGAEATRVDKLRRVVENEAALANLLVCADDPNVNCGRCEKCLRTMIPLRLLGIDHGPFPPLPPAKAIRKGGGIGADEWETYFFRENYELALETGGEENRDLCNALKARVKKAEVRRAIADLDRALLGGAVRRLLRVDKPMPGISLRPPRST
jgi:hypothetical protein